MRGCAQPKSKAQIVIENPQRLGQCIDRQRGADTRERQMRGGKRHAQRPVRRRAGQHHDDLRRASALGQVLGVS